jgi:hypothetical protein
MVLLLGASKEKERGIRNSRLPLDLRFFRIEQRKNNRKTL